MACQNVSPRHFAFVSVSPGQIAAWIARYRYQKRVNPCKRFSRKLQQLQHALPHPACGTHYSFLFVFLSSPSLVFWWSLAVDKPYHHIITAHDISNLLCRGDDFIISEAPRLSLIGPCCVHDRVESSIPTIQQDVTRDFLQENMPY